MAQRVQVILDDAERERYRRIAAQEGLSLSAWFRKAARERVAATPRPRLSTRRALKAFFAECDEREKGSEPDWEEHLGVIRRSIRAGGSGT